MKRLSTVLTVALLPVAMATAVVAGPAAASPAPAAYHATVLGSLDGGWVNPSALNNLDEVVGSGRSAAGQQHPFLWRAGTMVDLGPVPGSTEGFGTAQDINDRGQVVGTGDGGAFVWDRGVMTMLFPPGSLLSSADAINNAGQIVGSYFPPGDNAQHGYLWQRGRLTDLGYLAPVDINDRGQVLALRTFTGDEHRACVWWHGRVTDLGFDSAVAINNLGWVTGVTAVDNAFRAVLWRSGHLTRLGTLGGTDDAPSAINDRGQVLGTSRTANGELHGVIWQNGRTIDLSTRGVVLETVIGQAVPGTLTGINNRGHFTANLASPPNWSGPGVLFR